MLKPEQVPEEVWTQVALRLESAGALVSDRVARLVAAEVINAWPEMRISWLASNDGAIVLPLPPQEASDEPV
jgi:hypothetical protein